MTNPNLRYKDDLRLTLAEAATEISIDETEANNAGGADLPIRILPIEVSPQRQHIHRFSAV